MPQRSERSAAGITAHVWSIEKWSRFSFKIEVGMFGSLGYLALVLIPVYLVYRVWHHYRYTKTLEKALSEMAGKSH